MLGWLIDSVWKTIELPPHRHEWLLDIRQEVRGRTQVSLKRWYRLLGELRSMVLAIPGGQGLFSHLQRALRHTDSKRIRLDLDARDHNSSLIFTLPTHRRRAGSLRPRVPR